MRQPVSIALLLLLSGCTVGPDYRAPTMHLPGNWSEHPASRAEIARTASEMRDWWRRFDDPVLDRLVDEAVAGNLDLKIAGERLIAAQAQRQEISAQLRPQIEAQTQDGIQRFSTTEQFPPLPGVSSDNRLWGGGFSASWELDVFGRIRREIQAQDATVGATIEARRAALLMVLGQLASDYMALRSTQQQIDIAERNIRAARDGLGLSQREFAQGVGTSLQVAQAKAELETEEATALPLRTRIDQLGHALALLLGREPGALDSLLRRHTALPRPPALPVALPSMVVANRPDIREAERRYAESTAAIGVAVAQLYPEFSLPLSLGLQSSMVHELFMADSLAFQLVLSAAAPLYEGGRIHARVRRARAQAEQARLDYEKTVLTALREVEDRLAAYRNDRRRLAILRAAAADNALALSRARRLFAAGLTGFLEVLSAERATYESQNAAAVGDLALLDDAVGLYTALGAGWQGVALTATQLPVDLATQHAGAARAAGHR